jgi:hypothetical protein
MFTYQNELLKQFNDIIKKIDSNINELNLNQYDNDLITETNKFLSSASLILLQMNENSYNIPIKEIEEKYKELENRKKKISIILNKLNINLLNKVETKGDDEMKTLLEHNEQPIDVNYLTNYNETLLDGTLKNLREINNNLQDTAIGLKNQDEQLINTTQKMDINLQQVKVGNKLLNEIHCSSMCNKIWMFIVNILLFVIIVLLIILKLISYIS